MAKKTISDMVVDVGLLEDSGTSWFDEVWKCDDDGEAAFWDEFYLREEEAEWKEENGDRDLINQVRRVD